jgi:peptidylprolyl isomerase
MHTTTKILGLFLVAAGLAGCNGATPPSSNTGSAPGSGESTAPTEAGTAETDTAATWTVGDTIPSGRPGVPDLQILEVRANGSGPKPSRGMRATVAYKAMLADGTVVDPGTRPYTFTVGAPGVIEGWQVVVPNMRVGDSFTVTVPHQLAYGPARGDFKFDMELLSFQ